MTEEKTLIELRKEAKAIGIEGVNKMTKVQLAQAIEDGPTEAIEDKAPEVEVPVTAPVEKPAPVAEPAKSKEEPSKMDIDVTLAEEEVALTKERASLEIRQKAILTRLQQISKERDDKNVVIPYIEQLKKSKQFDRESDQTKAAALIEELKKLNL